jgi:hypothetical protein
MMKMLKKAGCRELLVGFESGDSAQAWLAYFRRDSILDLAVLLADFEFWQKAVGPVTAQGDNQLGLNYLYLCQQIRPERFLLCRPWVTIVRRAVF